MNTEKEEVDSHHFGFGIQWYPNRGVERDDALRGPEHDDWDTWDDDVDPVGVARLKKRQFCLSRRDPETGAISTFVLRSIEPIVGTQLCLRNDPQDYGFNALEDLAKWLDSAMSEALGEHKEAPSVSATAADASAATAAAAARESLLSTSMISLGLSVLRVEATIDHDPVTGEPRVTRH